MYFGGPCTLFLHCLRDKRNKLYLFYFCVHLFHKEIVLLIYFASRPYGDNLKTWQYLIFKCDTSIILIRIINGLMSCGVASNSSFYWPWAAILYWKKLAQLHTWRKNPGRQSRCEESSAMFFTTAFCAHIVTSRLIFNDIIFYDLFYTLRKGELIQQRNGHWCYFITCVVLMWIKLIIHRSITYFCYAQPRSFNRNLISPET